MAVKVRVEQSPLKVRVGQADAIKILSSAPIGSQTVKNVVGGIADVTALNVSGVSTFAGNINPNGNTPICNGNSWMTPDLKCSNFVSI